MDVSQKTFARKKPDQLVYLELDSGNGGMLLSVSEEGFRFRAVSPLRPGGSVPFAFSFDGKHRLEGVGEIEWLDEDSKSGGMRFAEVSNEFRAALSQWLASGPRHVSSGREVTPPVAVPLDTMEKIREELRRGYPGGSRSAPHAQKESSVEVKISPAKKEAAPPEPKSEAKVAEHKPEISDSQRPTPQRTSSQHAATPAEQRSQPNPRPPFSQQAAPSAPAESAPLHSAFLKLPREAPPIPSVPAPVASTTSTLPVAPEPASHPPIPHAPAPHSFAAPVVPEVPIVREAPHPLVPPAESVGPAPARLRIPPPEEPFDASWERAQLTAPADAHLNRAAAGSIIGLALLAILGALAFNFRQDVGAWVIELGRTISGENGSAAPAPATAESSSQPQISGEQKPVQRKPEIVERNQGEPAASGGVNSSQTVSGEASAGDAANANPGVAPTAASNATAKGAANPLANPAANPAAHSEAPGESSNTQAFPEAGSGQEEFNAAREILNGGKRRLDLPKAVNLLWASVRKGYVPAEVTLADLYRRGEGVPKNCDQVRVLLVAASRKGSPDARHMLEQMAEKGCE